MLVYAKLNNFTKLTLFHIMINIKSSMCLLMAYSQLNEGILGERKL